VPVASIPEPGSLVLALCGIGIVGLAGGYRSCRRRPTLDTSSGDTRLSS
jgi:hypothetical protein